MRPPRRPARHLFVLLAALLPAAAHAAPPPSPPPAPLVLQLSGARSVQFAGYYVAALEGDYAAEHLAVTIREAPPEADETPPAPGADVYSAWMHPALAANLPLVNIAQVFQQSGLVLICRKDSGIRAPSDFPGHSFGVWPGDAAIAVDAWLAKLAAVAPHRQAAVQIRPVPRAPGPAGIALLTGGRVDCLTGESYDQVPLLLSQGVSPDALQVFRFDELGLSPLQDGLYVPEAALHDPAKAALYVRFLRASRKGWASALHHRGLALRATIGANPPPAAAALARLQLAAIVPLATPGLRGAFYLEPLAWDRAVAELLAAHALPAWPAGAWTHAVWTAAARGSPDRSPPAAPP